MKTKVATSSYYDDFSSNYEQHRHHGYHQGRRLPGQRQAEGPHQDTSEGKHANHNQHRRVKQGRHRGWSHTCGWQPDRTPRSIPPHAPYRSVAAAETAGTRGDCLWCSALPRPLAPLRIAAASGAPSPPRAPASPNQWAAGRDVVSLCSLGRGEPPALRLEVGYYRQSSVIREGSRGALP